MDLLLSKEHLIDELIKLNWQVYNTYKAYQKTPKKLFPIILLYLMYYVMLCNNVHLTYVFSVVNKTIIKFLKEYISITSLPVVSVFISAVRKWSDPF